MKPLLLVKLNDDCTRQDHENIAKAFDGMSQDYDILIYDHADIRVYGLFINPFTYLFNKLKVWVILKTKRRK